MPKKVEKTRGNGRYTEAGYFGWIRAQLRRAKWPVKYDVYNAAKRKYEGPNKLQKHEYQCSECKGWFKRADVEADHIKPCGTLKSFDDLPEFVATLFCEIDNFRILCKECHKRVTKEQRTNDK